VGTAFQYFPVEAQGQVESWLDIRGSHPAIVHWQIRFSVSGTIIRHHHRKASGWNIGHAPIEPMVPITRIGVATSAAAILIGRTAAPRIHASAALGLRIVPPQRGQNFADAWCGAGQEQTIPSGRAGYHSAGGTSNLAMFVSSFTESIVMPRGSPLPVKWKVAAFLYFTTGGSGGSAGIALSYRIHPHLRRDKVLYDLANLAPHERQHRAPIIHPHLEFPVAFLHNLALAEPVA
jgi:hypothetical protein